MRSHVFRPHLFSKLILAGFAASLALAQQFPLQMIATTNGLVATIPNGAQLPFAVSVGQSQTIHVAATYAGSGKITISQAPQVFGSTEFSDSFQAKLPLTLNPGDSFTFDLIFRPTTATQASAIFNLPFTETVPGTGAGNPPPVITSNAINLTLVGSAASFVLSYIKNGNVVPLPTGGSIVFDAIPVNATETLALNITDNGSASGQVTDIEISGKSFTLVGKPLFPATIQAGSTLQVGVAYKPTEVASDTGQVVITFSDGTTSTVGLQGSGTSPTLVYTLIQNGKSTPILPGGTITLPDTDVGSTATATIRVQNTGNGSTIVNSVNAAGQGFSVSGLPVLPKTLDTNDSFNFTLTFAPTQPGVQNGQLLVGTDLFNLSGKGLGSKLEYSYTADGVTLTIGTNGVTSVVFSPVQVTKSEQIPFKITNKGTLPAVISNIAINDNKSPFSISGAPSLPDTLAPGASISFEINFAPTATGVSNGTLLINTDSVPLSGSATAPPPLPAYTISGPSGTVAPQSQPSVTLKLASAYPVAINGILTLTTFGTLGSDPAVQFSTGGRTVPFTIPANSTVANFASQGNQILLQTGTVASTITLTPQFATAAGVDLTPDNPTTLQFEVPSAAPVLLAGVESASSSTSIVLTFTGFTTTRTLTKLDVQFTAAPGFTLASPQVSVDLRQAATVWFESSGSQSFGGQFTVTVPFTFSGTVATGHTLLQAIASVSATISNEVGASNSVSSPIQ